MSTREHKREWWDDPPPRDGLNLAYRRVDDLSTLRSAAAGCAAKAGMTAERIEHVLLAVTELASNTIRHTHGAGLLRMWQSGGDLMVQVSDEGSLPEVAGAAAVSRALPAPGAVGGYGLALVAQFSDEMLVHRAPATIRLRFRRS